jgi:hypothetical protein
LVIGRIFTLLGIIAAVLGINTNQNFTHASAATATPTASKASSHLLTFFPGMENVTALDSWTILEPLLNAKGHKVGKIFFDNQYHFGGSVDYPCTDDEANICLFGRVGADFEVQGDKIQSVVVNFEKGASGFPFVKSIWDATNPAQLIRKFGTPVEVKGHLSSLGDGFLITILIVWDDIAVQYHIRNLVPGEFSNTVNFCLTPMITEISAFKLNK